MFIMLYKVVSSNVRTFKSEHETLVCESYWAVLFGF